jgi:hypothetical protein
VAVKAVGRLPPVGSGSRIADCRSSSGAPRRRRPAEGGEPRHAAHRGRASRNRSAHADDRRSKRWHALCRAVAAAAGPREDPPRLPAVPAVRRYAGAGDAARDRAVLRQHRPRGPSGARPADGRLLVRERAAREALQHRQRHGQRVQARGAAGVSPRAVRSGQHPDADVGRRPDLAGAARQVGDGSPARIAASRRHRRTCRRSTTPRRRSAART